MILPICVISLYCNIKHLFETWKYLYKSGSLDDKCIDSQHFGTCDSHTDFKVKRSKVKSRGGGILWRPPSRTACYLSINLCYVHYNKRKLGTHVFPAGHWSVLGWVSRHVLQSQDSSSPQVSTSAGTGGRRTNALSHHPAPPESYPASTSPWRQQTKQSKLFITKLTVTCM